MVSVPSSLLIKDAVMLLPMGEMHRGDILIREGKIVSLDPEDVPEDVPEDIAKLEAQGNVLLPGVIDPQVHFRDPGLTHKEDLFTASRACARGGVTSFLEMPNTNPPTIDQAALDAKLVLASQKSMVNYGFFIGATPENLPDLREANPTPGIKIFMGSAHGRLLVSTEEELEPIFAQGDRLIAVHAENQARIMERRQQFAGVTDPAMHAQIQDKQAAMDATQLALKLSKKYQRRLHILHLSTGAEAELLRHDKPHWVTAEVLPQHLLLNTSHYEQLGTLIQMNPPIRDVEDNEILWQALLDGVIDFIATDHAPHTLEEKGRGYPNTPSGMPGVETSLPLMLTQAKAGKCTVAQVSKWMSTAVAEHYRIPNKGAIAPGYDADLVLVDLEHYHPVLREELQTKCGWSPYEGWSLTGWPLVTLVGGQVVYDHGKFNSQARGSALRFDG